MFYFDNLCKLFSYQTSSSKTGFPQNAHFLTEAPYSHSKLQRYLHRYLTPHKKSLEVYPLEREIKRIKSFPVFKNKNLHFFQANPRIWEDL